MRTRTEKGFQAKFGTNYATLTGAFIAVFMG